MKNLNTIKWVIGIILAIILIGFIYSTFFKANVIGMGDNTLIFVIGALIMGAILSWLINRSFFNKSSEAVTIKESSHTVIESMRKVFKIVTAEGHFNEIYNYEESKNLFGFIPTQKKALVIVQAKALIGYDFEKCKWELDADNQKVKIINFPAPEILSMDTDYKYYNIEENLLNKFSREDLANIQRNGKKQVELAARNSNLKGIAAEQMRTLLTEIVLAKDWKLENAHMITEQIPESTENEFGAYVHTIDNSKNQ